MKEFVENNRRILGLIGALVALVVAVIYLKFTPEEAAQVGGFQKVILIYGHSVCWFLLSGAGVLRAISKNRSSEILAYIALIAYAIFIATFLITKLA